VGNLKKDVVIVPPVQAGAIPFMHGINISVGALSAVTTQDKKINFLANNTFQLLRIPVYWESYLVDPVGYIANLQEIADAADLRDMKVIYDFKQYNLSSYFGAGLGFPPALVQSVIGPLSAYPTVKDAQKAFMRKYWDNSAQWNYMSLWDAQADFMKTVLVEPFRNRASTLGYEIFNEPPLLEDADHEKLKACFEHIGNRLVTIDPDAYIAAGHRFLLYIAPTGSFWSVALIQRTMPAIINGKVIYTPHWYLDATLGQAGFEYVSGQILKIQQATNTKVILGEWNDRTNPADPAKYAKLIAVCKLNGWSHALWEFDGSDKGNRCFNENYDIEHARNVWPTLLCAMGVPQVGAPK